VHIVWGGLLLVLVVGLAAGTGIVALFSLGVAIYAGTDGPSRSRRLAYVCFGACAVLVLYGIWLAVSTLH
jgi:hypothetical protein